MSKTKRAASQPGLDPNRFQALVPPEELAAFLAELEVPLPPSLRVNPLKNGREQLPDWRSRYGWQLEPVVFCPDGWKVNAWDTPPSQTIEHRLGYYYIQDSASMLPPELFDLDGLDAPLVLDMAASPGGKTTHLSARMGDRGLLLANDSSPDRVTALRVVLANWGSAGAVVTNFPGEKFGAWFPATFDRVLLDAPCSMQGLRTAESHPTRPVTEREVNMLARRQTGLLRSALRAVKPGGQVVYSTCTLEPAEDEGVLSAVLAEFGGSARLDDVSSRVPRPAPGLSGPEFDPRAEHALRLWPHRLGTAGFFAARLTVLETLPGETAAAPERPLTRAGLLPLAHKTCTTLAADLLDTYGLELEPLLNENGLALLQRYETIYAVPELYLQRFSSLPAQALGLALGELRPEGFAISEEALTRWSERIRAGWLELDEQQATAWVRGEDLHGAASPLSVGRVCGVRAGGRVLGRGKVLSGRVKNLLLRKALGR